MQTLIGFDRVVVHAGKNIVQGILNNILKQVGSK